MFRPLLLAAVLVLVPACGRGATEIEPAPGRPDETTTTTASPDPTEADDVETAESVVKTSTTTPPTATASTTTVLIDENSENAAAYTELAASGLVLTLDEQGCADGSVREQIEAGVARVDAVITAVQSCASPRAVDDFAAGLISAGGSPLPPTEAACVASRLRSGDEYRPFWVALFAEDPFDFLVAPADAQDRYLDLYSECVSVGRALSEQIGGALSAPTIACIDDLYQDREFVRTTIEADLSADDDEIARVNRQIGTCLTGAERDALGLG